MTQRISTGWPRQLVVGVAKQQEGGLLGATNNSEYVSYFAQKNRMTLLCLRHPDNKLSGPSIPFF